MDPDDEARKVKVLLVVVVLFIASAVGSCREASYSLFGKKTDAALVRVYEYQEPARRGRTVTKVAVEYQFDDKGTMRKESDNIARDADRPSGKTIPIQYVSGTPGRSRLAGHVNWIWPTIFFASLAVMAYYVWRLLKESKS